METQSNVVVTQQKSSQWAVLEKVLLYGDLKDLTSEQRVMYIEKLCKSVGLNPLTRPFEFMVLNGKLVAYAKRDATDQLRKLHDVSIKMISREKVGNIFIVTTQATLPNGRVDESIGAVSLSGLKGDDDLANRIMKAETKAKRRVTLSICGLGLLDETEVETIVNVNDTVKPKAISPPATTDRGDTSPVTSVSSPEKAIKDENDPYSDHGTYVIPIGTIYKGKRLNEVPMKTLRDFVSQLQKQSGKEHDAQVREFLFNAVAYLDEMAYRT